MENIAGSLLLNRFRVDELLYSGATVARYSGYDLKRGLPLLIKAYATPIQADDTVLCFQQKNLTLQTIDHPNVIPFYGLYEDQGRSFMVEKFFEGPSLAQLLYQGEGKPRPLPEALIYLKALATALEYMHGFGLVHATLDFANIQVGRDGSIMLGNFGFARLADKPMTLTGVFGPPFCQAPEQLRGERVYPTTDVYAQGVLFYELATGVHPFLGVPSAHAEHNPALVSRLREAHLTQAPPDMDQFNPALPGGLSKTIQTALAKDPKQRYHAPSSARRPHCVSSMKRAGCRSWTRHWPCSRTRPRRVISRSRCSCTALRRSSRTGRPMRHATSPAPGSCSRLRVTSSARRA